MEHVIRTVTRDDIPLVIKLRANLITLIPGNKVSEADVLVFRNFHEHAWDGKQPAYYVRQPVGCISG
ncbi:MAG: hypothetical protein GYA24_22310 [Candidatus Lokiarchaeota archaeon]|nr:hypothetical protein [Candidatus Lokiarchaeota archaeon]